MVVWGMTNHGIIGKGVETCLKQKNIKRIKAIIYRTFYVNLYLIIWIEYIS